MQDDCHFGKDIVIDGTSVGANVDRHVCLKIYFVYVYLKNDLFSLYYICKLYQF